VKNVGDTQVAAWHMAGLTRDGASMEWRDVPVSLAPNQEYSDRFGIVLSVTGGSDQITVCADVDEDVAESAEDNNCQAFTVFAPG
jgi:subtilase family serine protease